MCLRYIFGPHLITRNGYWIRSLSSSTPMYSKPLCSITQCNVIEFSCYKSRGKRNQKTHFEHPQNFLETLSINVWSAYEFLSLFHFLARWVINLSLIYGHLWWYCSTSDKHVSGNEKGAPHLSCTLAVTQNACTICKNKNIANDEIGAFFKRNWNT